VQIRLQTTVTPFDDSFVEFLPVVEKAMIDHGLDPRDFIIAKDRTQFNSFSGSQTEVPQLYGLRERQGFHGDAADRSVVPQIFLRPVYCPGAGRAFARTQIAGNYRALVALARSTCHGHSCRRMRRCPRALFGRNDRGSFLGAASTSGVGTNRTNRDVRGLVVIRVKADMVAAAQFVRGRPHFGIRFPLNLFRRTGPEDFQMSSLGSYTAAF
jgi:hypothetical protein